MKKLILSLFIAFQSMAIAHSQEEIKFVSYDNVIKELKESKNISQFEFKFNYEYILLLDSTEKELILRTGFTDLEGFRLNAIGISNSSSSIGFVTDKKTITEIFNNKNELKRILICSKPIDSPDIKMVKFEYPIYFKNNKAIFTTSGPTWSDTYFAELEKGILRINWLSGIIE